MRVICHFVCVGSLLALQQDGIISHRETRFICLCYFGNNVNSCSYVTIHILFIHLNWHHLTLKMSFQAGIRKKYIYGRGITCNYMKTWEMRIIEMNRSLFKGLFENIRDHYGYCLRHNGKHIEDILFLKERETWLTRMFVMLVMLHEISVISVVTTLLWNMALVLSVLPHACKLW